MQAAHNLKGGYSAMSADNKKNALSRALRHPYHLVAAAAVCSISVAMLEVWPLIAGVAMEAVYLTCSLLIAGGVRIQVGEAAAQPIQTPNAKSKDAPPKKQPLAIVETDDAAGMRSSRAEQISHLDATFRLIGMRMETERTAQPDLIEGLTALREKFQLFARSEFEHELRLQRYASDAHEEAKHIRDAPASGLDAFAPTLRLVTDTSADRGPEGEKAVDTRRTVRDLLSHYDWQLREITWQREQLPAGSQATQDLEAHAFSVLKRRKYIDRAGTLLTSLHYEMDLIVRKFEATSTEIGTRQPNQILSDIKALLLQTEAVTRSLRELEQDDRRAAETS